MDLVVLGVSNNNNKLKIELIWNNNFNRFVLITISDVDPFNHSERLLGGDDRDLHETDLGRSGQLFRFHLSGIRVRNY